MPANQNLPAEGQSSPKLELATGTVGVGSFQAVFERLVLPAGLVLDKIEIEGGPVQLGLGNFSYQLGQPANFKVSISQGSIEGFLNAKRPGGLKDFAVQLNEGHMVVSATINVLIDMRAQVKCHLEIRNQTEIDLVLESAQVSGVGAKNLIESQVRQLNPVFSATMLPLPAELTDVSVHEGAILATGRFLAVASTA